MLNGGCKCSYCLLSVSNMLKLNTCSFQGYGIELYSCIRQWHHRLPIFIAKCFTEMKLQISLLLSLSFFLLIYKQDFGAWCDPFLQGGYRGFYSKNTIRLTPKTVNDIHKRGGTILGTSRGGHDTSKIVDSIQDRGINQVCQIVWYNVVII